MSNPSIDPGLLQDFLTESGELLEHLDQDLVTLEQSPKDGEMLNQVFRALHTIKGSASFLALTNLVGIAHVAEGALNTARRGGITIDKAAMDLLLAAVDIIKKQFEELRVGQDLSAAEPALIEALSALADGKQRSVASSPTPAPQAAPSAPSPSPTNTPPAIPGSSDPADLGAATEKPLSLPANKADLLEYLVADLDQTLDQVEHEVKALTESGTRKAAAEHLADLAESLRKSVDFFEFDSMTSLAKLFAGLAEAAPRMSDSALSQAMSQAQRVLTVLRTQSAGLAKGKQIIPPTEPMCEAFHNLLHADHPALSVPVAGATPAVDAPGSVNEPADAAPAPTPTTAGQTAGPTNTPTPSASPAGAAPAKAEHGEKPASSGGAAAADATIRVEVSRLESLLNLVGELVLQKNRVTALARQLQSSGSLAQNLRETAVESAGALDRVTGDLQAAVMKTRMQPLEKIFGKYPRLVRDLARKLNKQMELVVEGAETEVDKSVIEELGDPLVHLMRNSADHGIESAEKRVAAGKPEAGTIRLSASNTGGHVVIRISDDGKGLDGSMLAKKAVEKGVITQLEADSMSDRERMRLIFKPGFSTAEKLSDVSGRGVGMDVVATNIAKIKGTIDLESQIGKGTTIIITIPLTVAIMSAMMVGVGREIYAVPLSNIVEIVKPDPAQLSSVNRCSVMRLRDAVLPLIESGEVLGQPVDQREKSPFAVVVAQNEKRVGLMVSRLIGQQEVVIKPLDEFIDNKKNGGGAVSGATVRDDGGVSLIVDVSRLIRLAEERQRAERP